MGLRLSGWGLSTQLFLSRELNGEKVGITNGAFFQQFYTMPIVWAPHEVTIPVAKPPNTYRIFVFGSSAAEGVPAPDFSFWRILGTMLRARHYDGKIEVYGMAMAGANSHVMRAAAKACAAYHPDLFLVYMGNNELSPSVTQSLVWDNLPPWLALRLLHASIALNELRLVQFMQGIRGQNDLNHPRGQVESVLDPERAYAYYAANVNDICRFGSEAGAQVILCTVGSRLRDWIPAGAHATPLDSSAAAEWDRAYLAGNGLREQGRFREALAEYVRAAAIDGSQAELAYGIACCHHALGEYAAARNWFVRSRESDTMQLRAGNRINTILREIASARERGGVHLADAAEALAVASPQGIEGPELFLDPVHLTFEGNYVLARSVLEVLARTESRFGGQATALSSEECRMRLAFTQADLREQLELTLKSTAFSGRQPKEGLEHALAELDRQIGTGAVALRLEGCRTALEADPQDEVIRIRYIKLLLREGDKAHALEQARILTADFPFSCEGHRYLAQLLALSGDKRGAIEVMRLLLAWHPDDADVYMGLGQFLCEENRPDDALAAFRVSFKLKPRAQAQCGIARAMSLQGNFTGSIQAYRQCLELQPGDGVVFEELIIALCDAGRVMEAKTEIEGWRAAGRAVPPGAAGKVDGIIAHTLPQPPP